MFSISKKILLVFVDVALRFMNMSKDIFDNNNHYFYYFLLLH